MIVAERTGDDVRVTRDGVELDRFTGGWEGWSDARIATDGSSVQLVSGDVVRTIPLGAGQPATLVTGVDCDGVIALDATWTLEVRGAVRVDGGHTPHSSYQGHFGFSRDTPIAERAAAQRRGEREHRVAARIPRELSVALRRGDDRVVVHEERRRPVAGTTALMWPPVAAPAGVLLRRIVEVRTGLRGTHTPQRPWLVRPDLTVVEIPEELGVAPLCAVGESAWLLPGAEGMWRDGYDEELHVLALDGTTSPLLVAGRPIRPSDVLRAVAPHLLVGLEPIDYWSAPCEALAAREERGGAAIVVVVRVDGVDDAPEHLVVARLPLGPAGAVEGLAVLAQPPGGELVVAP